MSINSKILSTLITALISNAINNKWLIRIVLSVICLWILIQANSNSKFNLLRSLVEKRELTSTVIFNYLLLTFLPKFIRQFGFTGRNIGRFDASDGLSRRYSKCMINHSFFGLKRISYVFDQKLAGERIPIK